MSAKHKLGPETVNLNLVGALWNVLIEEEPLPVRRQTALELLVMRHAAGTGHREKALLVVDGLCKHVRQIIEQAPSDYWRHP